MTPEGSQPPVVERSDTTGCGDGNDDANTDTRMTPEGSQPPVVERSSTTGGGAETMTRTRMDPRAAETGGRRGVVGLGWLHPPAGGVATLNHRLMASTPPGSG